MKQLVIDTASYNGGVGIIENERILGIFYLNVPLTHSQRLLHQVYSLLQSLNLSVSDLNAVTFSMGPGTFTGLRIGLATAKSLSFCLEIPLLMVPTLEAYAMAIPGKGFKAPLLDARKKEVFAALYEDENQEFRPLIKPTVISINDFLASLPGNQTIHFFGSGAQVYKTVIEKTLGNYACFTAEDILMRVIPALGNLGYKRFKNKEFADIISAEPYYIRRSDAEIAKGKNIEQ